MSQTDMDGLNSPTRGAAQPGEIPVWTQEKHLPDKSISSPSHTHNNHHEITEDFTIASILIIAYLTETVVQVSFSFIWSDTRINTINFNFEFGNSEKTLS